MPKRAGHIKEKMVSEENICEAYRLASYHGILQWCDGHRLHRMYIDPIITKMEATA